MLFVFCSAIYSGCYQASTTEKASVKRSPYVYKETIVGGNDTGIIRLGGFKRINIADILCQHWQLSNRKAITASVFPDPEVRKSIVREMVLFKDSTVALSPMGTFKPGTWQIRVENKLKYLMLWFQGGAKKQYIIEELSSTSMQLVIPEKRSFLLQFSAPGQVHQNMHNDPFHPQNNQWRIQPAKEETDSAIHARIKNCLLFFALYYRDHIKMEAETISFEGLPSIFEWYNGGIGLPNKDEISNSWIDCFYNKEQALKGYAILRRLIVDYDFNWPKGAPGWIYRTHSVLEQMYHKIDDVKVDQEPLRRRKRS